MTEETVVSNEPMEEATAKAPEARETSQENSTGEAAGAEEAVKAEKEKGEELESIQRLLAEAAQKRDEYLSMAQRVQADFENYKRRNQNARKESFDDGAKAFVTVLLPVIDNLERAIDAAQNSPDESLKSGVELVLRQMMDALEKRGVTPVSRLGELFDPNLENAVMRGTPEEGEPGTVCAVFQKGYLMDGKLLRAAMVKVVPEE